MIQTEEKNVANIDRSKKGNDVVRYEVQSNSDLADSNDGWGVKGTMFCITRRGTHLICMSTRAHVTRVKLEEEEEVLPESNNGGK